MRIALVFLSLLCFGTSLTGIAQKKVHTIIVDDRLGILYGQIRYQPGCLKNRIRFWEYGVPGAYRIDVRTIEQISVDGVGSFIRFPFSTVATYGSMNNEYGAEESGYLFLRLICRGGTFTLYEHYDNGISYYFYYDEMAKRMQPLKYEAIYLTNDRIRELVPACRGQLTILAQRENIDLPENRLRCLNYDEKDLCLFIKILNKDKTVADIDPPKEALRGNYWSLGVEAGYGQLSSTKSIQNSLLKYKRIPAPIFCFTGLREWRVSKTWFRAGFALSYARFYSDPNFIGDQRIKLLVQQYGIRPLLGLHRYLSPGNMALALGFTASYNFPFYQKNISIGSHFSKDHLKLDYTSLAVETNLLLQLTKQWRLEADFGLNIFMREFFSLETENTPISIFTGIGLNYRWNK